MAHHASAKKRIRQDIKRRANNRLVVATLRTHIKRFRKAVEEGDREQAEKLLPDAIRGLDKAVSKGCIHKKTASRKISRLTRSFAKMA